MISLRSSLAVVAVAIFSFNAQAATQYSIDPNSVDLATRESWCVSQKASCPLLCLQNTGAQDASTAENDCDPDTLSYSCICGNGITPDAGNYSQTIPFFLCQEYGNQCVNGCGTGNTPCQTACRVDNPCGAQNPTRVNTTSSSTMPATATSTSTSTNGPVVYSGLGGDGSSSSSSSSSSTSSDKNAALATLDLGRSYGLAVVFAGLFAGFAILL
ncbi:hypothetical protein B0O99DRAFT_105489 [Bisporella sp. PMI_857]|nr:hypothetical protein B0O99DRAFT_105489 [Bisporella sp. PMI_857]